MNKKIILAILLLVLGLAGVLSTLSMNIPLTPEQEAILSAQFTPEQIKLLTLVNPTILLIIALAIGVGLKDKVALQVPVFEFLVGPRTNKPQYKKIALQGLYGGVLAGVLLSLIGFIYNPLLPEEFKLLGESLKPTLAARFLYGGITEELLMRFGLMTLIIWLLATVSKQRSNWVYFMGIAISALVFAFGHFPVAYQAVEHPSVLWLSYIILGNTIGGIIFGWLYWKRGLESAMIAHIFAHIIMVIAETSLNLA